MKISLFIQGQLHRPRDRQDKIRICREGHVFFKKLLSNPQEEFLSFQLTEDESISKVVLDNVPMSRFGLPEEMASVASFLCSDDSSYITGENIAVCGGTQTRL